MMKDLRCGLLSSRVMNSLQRSVLPNMRLKLAAPTSKGIHLFVNDTALRRSLSAFR